MEIETKIRLRKKAFQAVLFILAILGLVFLTYLAGLRVNFTPSYPRGLYKLSKNTHNIETGELIAFCPPNTDIFKEALEREYIRQGNCKGGLPPFIKRVVGQEGDYIEITDHVTINGIKQINSEIQKADSEGRTLTSAKSEYVKAEHIFVLSEYSASSLDSRYFGQIPKSWIIARAKPLWVEGSQ